MPSIVDDGGPLDYTLLSDSWLHDWLLGDHRLIGHWLLGDNGLLGHDRRAAIRTCCGRTIDYGLITYCGAAPRGGVCDDTMGAAPLHSCAHNLMAGNPAKCESATENDKQPRTEPVANLVTQLAQRCRRDEVASRCRDYRPSQVADDEPGAR